MPKWRVDVLLLRNRQPQGAVEAETVINKLRLPELPEVERAASESCWRPSGNVNKTSCFWRFLGGFHLHLASQHKNHVLYFLGCIWDLDVIEARTSGCPSHSLLLDAKDII